MGNSDAGSPNDSTQIEQEEWKEVCTLEPTSKRAPTSTTFRVGQESPRLLKQAEVDRAKELVDPRLLKPGCINDKGMLERLYKANFTHDEIADYFGVSRVAVTSMINRMDLQRTVSTPDEFREKMQEEILVRMENLLRYMTASKMDKASLSQLVIAFGTLYDKLRLSRGESTQNVAAIQLHKIDSKDIEKIKDIIKKHTEKKLEAAKQEYVTS